MSDFEFIEHTADVGVRVYGFSLEELFRNAALVLFGLMVDYEPRPEIEERVIVEAEDSEELLITWLNELISLFFAYKFLPASYSIEIEDRPEQKVLKSCLRGENFNPYENKLKMEIKAATYHDLKVSSTDDGWVAEIIFDV
ncbi:MAG: archease [Candidatus Omnitrophica bacterium]|nr:archease [Candidatus Omnitrophota bacterium]